jgi:hypothetical protein
MQYPVVNAFTGKPNRSNRVRAMSLAPKAKENPTPSLANRFWNSKLGKKIINVTSNGSLPEGSMKITRTKGGGTRKRNYNLRAAQFLSERSPALQTSNLKVLTSKRNRNTIRKALNQTRRNK